MMDTQKLALLTSQIGKFWQTDPSNVPSLKHMIKKHMLLICMKFEFCVAAKELRQETKSE